MAHAEFVLSHRLHQTNSRNPGLEAMVGYLERLTAHADVLNDSHAQTQESSKRRIVRINADEHHIDEQLQNLHPDVILEPRVFFRAHSLCQLAGGRLGHLHPKVLPPKDHTIQVTVVTKRSPLPDAGVTLMYRDAGGKVKMLPPVETDSNGQCELHFGADCTPLAVGSNPAFGFWSAFANITDPSETSITLECGALPQDGPLGWWHNVMGIENYEPESGKGVRIGIVGTGVTPHPNLKHVIQLDGKDDISSHGTHVCGLVAARPNARSKNGDYAGFAPGAEVFTLRVFELNAEGKMVLPDQADLAHAIDEFAGHGLDPANRVDLINLSLGSRSDSQCIQDAINNAFDTGTVCVCSAGNSGQQEVEYPAALPQTIGVSGLGLEGWAPDNSISAFETPPQSHADRFGDDGIFLAKFSCFGAPQVTCAGPANGIISTVPPQAGTFAPYAVMDGTSLSSPAVCGLLARILSRSNAVQNMPVSASRSRAIVQLLEDHSQQIGLQQQFQGAGLPELARQSTQTQLSGPHWVKKPKEQTTKSES